MAIGSTQLRNSYFIGAVDDAKGVEEPNHYADYHDDIKNFLNLAIHGNVRVYQPKQYSHDD